MKLTKIIIALAVLLFATSALASSVNFKLYSKDMKKIRQAVAKESSLVIEAINSFSDNDVAAIIRAQVRNPFVKLESREAKKALKKLQKYYNSRPNKKNIVFAGWSLRAFQDGIEYNGGFWNIFEYDMVAEKYSVFPKDEEFGAFMKEQAAVMVDIMDACFKMRDAANEHGLLGMELPKYVSDSRFEMGEAYPLLLNPENPKNNQAHEFIFKEWIRSRHYDYYLDSYELLTVQKIMLEFLFNNDLAFSYKNMSAAVLTEIEKIDESLAKLQPSPQNTTVLEDTQQQAVDADDEGQTQPAADADTDERSGSLIKGIKAKLPGFLKN
jgi:hypothetical protein